MGSPLLVLTFLVAIPAYFTSQGFQVYLSPREGPGEIGAVEASRCARGRKQRCALLPKRWTLDVVSMPGAELPGEQDKGDCVKNQLDREIHGKTLLTSEDCEGRMARLLPVLTVLLTEAVRKHPFSKYLPSSPFSCSRMVCRQPRCRGPQTIPGANTVGTRGEQFIDCQEQIFPPFAFGSRRTRIHLAPSRFNPTLINSFPLLILHLAVNNSRRQPSRAVEFQKRTDGSLLVRGT